MKNQTDHYRWFAPPLGWEEQALKQERIRQAENALQETIRQYPESTSVFRVMAEKKLREVRGY